MVNDNYLEELITRNLNLVLKEDMQTLIQHVSCWFAYSILYKTRYRIDHSDDPAWDSSGNVKATGNNFDISDYETLQDFSEQEFNGNTTSSYISGNGFFHDTYNDELVEICRQWILSCLEKTADLLYEKDHTFQTWVDGNRDTPAEKPCEIVLFTDIIGDHIVHLEYQYEEMMKQTSAILLFQMGKARAIEKRKNEEAQRKRGAEENHAMQERAIALYEKIQNIHRLQTGQEVPVPLEKPYFNEFVVPILKALLNMGVPEKSIQELRTVIKCSNSVQSALESFRK